MSIKRLLTKDKDTIFWSVKIFFIWRISLFIFAWIGIHVLPFKNSFPYVKEILQPFGNPLFWSWANFDGVHYLGIAQKGYFAQFTQAFFPLYPLLIRWLNIFFNNLLFSGLFISNFTFLSAIYFLYKLLSLDYDKKIVRNTIIFLVFFPTSFFFGSLYSESLFLLLIISSLYLARKKNLFLAGFLGILASLTRIIGVLAIPAFLWEWNESIKRKKKTLKDYFGLLYSIMPIAGLGIYMKFLQDNYSDALYFFHAQPAFGASRTTNRIILLYQVFYRYIKMLFSFNGDYLFYYAVSLEFIVAIIFLFLLILGFK